MEKLGQLLKAEREKKGLSLHEIGMNLKINPKILKAIEDNDNTNLPAKTFLRGFVRSYAQYLRIDVNHALKLFQEEYGSTRPEEARHPEQEGTSQTPKENVIITPTPKYNKPLKKTEDIALPKQSGGRWAQIIAAILILITIAFVVKMIDKYQKESEITKETLPVTSPIDVPTTTLAQQGSDLLATPVTTTIHSGGMTPVPPVAVSSTTMKAAAVIVTTTTLKPTTTTTVKVTTTSTTLKPTTTTVKTTTTSTTIKPTTTTTTQKPTTTTTTTNSTTTTLANAPKVVEVIVEALNTVQVKYSLGGEATQTMDLTPDQVHTFRSKKVQLDINDGGAVNIIVNGRDRGVPGTIGKPIKLTFP